MALAMMAPAMRRVWGHVFHTKQAGDSGVDGGAAILQFVQYFGNSLYPALQRVGGRESHG